MGHAILESTSLFYTITWSPNLHLRQLLHHLPLVRHKHWPALRGVERPRAVDAELGVNRGGDVFGQVRSVEDIAPLFVGAADDLAAGDARTGEGVRVAVGPVVAPLILV